MSLYTLHRLGDLNYRLVFKREKIMQLIEIQHFDALLRGDQLTLQREEGKTFVDFQEGKLVSSLSLYHHTTQHSTLILLQQNFPPTYRYERGCNEFSKKVISLSS